MAFWVVLWAACVLATAFANYGSQPNERLPPWQQQQSHSSQSDYNFESVQQPPPRSQSGYGVPSAPSASYQQPAHEESQKGMPFSYAFNVQDEYSGNDYSHQSDSDGDTVQGSYRVLLPDGRTQIVTYRADHESGFVAEVRYEGEARPFHHTPQDSNRNYQASQSQNQVYQPQSPQPSKTTYQSIQGDQVPRRPADTYQRPAPNSPRPSASAQYGQFSSSNHQRPQTPPSPVPAAVPQNSYQSSTSNRQPQSHFQVPQHSPPAKSFAQPFMPHRSFSQQTRASSFGQRPPSQQKSARALQHPNQFQPNLFEETRPQQQPRSSYEQLKR